MFAVAGAARAQTVTGFATIRYGSGNSFQGETELELTSAAVQNLGPITSQSPASVDPANPGTSSTQEAVLAMDLGAGVFAMAAGSEGAVLGFGVTRFGTGTTRVDYRENVLVDSATVADGTPVAIRLRYRIAYGRECLHALTPEQLAIFFMSYACTTELEVRAVLNDLLGTVDTTAQTHFVNLGFTPTIDGLFADPTQSDELSITAEVGDSIRVEIFAEAAGSHRLGGPFQSTLPEAASGASLALVFGVESDTPGVEVVSPLLGGPLPDFAGVTAENALTHVLDVSVGAPFTVPEPSVLALAAVACATLLARRRYAASQASA